MNNYSNQTNNSAEKPKYPNSLFIFGVISNFLFHYFLLFFISIILLIIGIWNKGCLFLGFILILLNLILSLVEQFKIRNAMLNSDNPFYNNFQDAFRSPDWLEHTKDIFESETKDNE